MRSVLFVVILSSCAKPVPEHLRVQPKPEAVSQSDLPKSATEVLTVMLHGDPLARSPKLLVNKTLLGIPETQSIRSYHDTIHKLERGEGEPARELEELESTQPGSPAVGLARGYRLQLGETLLAQSGLEQGLHDPHLLALWSPLTVSPSTTELTRPPFAWLLQKNRAQSIRAWSERWVLLGWLDSPNVPLKPIADALTAPQFDSLSSTPAARIILARASEQAPVEEEIEGGLNLLTQATKLSLTRAAADRDNEQAAWAKKKSELKASLHTEDPISHLSKSALVRLTAASRDDEAAGGALIALAALRLQGECEVKPCGGMDRVESFRRAAQYGGQNKALAAVWRTIALKDALDAMDVGRQTVLFPKAAANLTEAILGSGGGPLSSSVIRKQSEDASFWLALCEGIGEPGNTEWDEARAALGKHMQSEISQAIPLQNDEEIVQLLKRISSRVQD